MEPTTLVKAKPWWQAKTTWLGIAQLVVGVAEVVATTPLTEGSEIAGVAIGVSGFLTILLRALTTRPVSTSEKPVEVPAAQRPGGIY